MERGKNAVPQSTIELSNNCSTKTEHKLFIDTYYVVTVHCLASQPTYNLLFLLDTVNTLDAPSPLTHTSNRIVNCITIDNQDLLPLPSNICYDLHPQDTILTSKNKTKHHHHSMFADPKLELLGKQTNSTQYQWVEPL